MNELMNVPNMTNEISVISSIRRLNYLEVFSTKSITKKIPKDIKYDEEIKTKNSRTYLEFEGSLRPYTHNMTISQIPNYLRKYIIMMNKQKRLLFYIDIILGNPHTKNQQEEFDLIKKRFISKYHNKLLIKRDYSYDIELQERYRQIREKYLNDSNKNTLRKEFLSRNRPFHIKYIASGWKVKQSLISYLIQKQNDKQLYYYEIFNKKEIKIYFKDDMIKLLNEHFENLSDNTFEEYIDYTADRLLSLNPEDELEKLRGNKSD